MWREQARRVRVAERREPSSPGGVQWIVDGRASGRRRRPWDYRCGRHHRSAGVGPAPYSFRRRGIRAAALPGRGEPPPTGSDRQPDWCRPVGLRERPLAYPVLPPDHGCGVPPAVHEPSPTRYRATSPQSAAAVVRARHRRRPSGPRSAQIRLTLKPGQKGTQQLVATYGERLVCVRYRYDPGRKKRFKTVEIIVGERDWEPPRPRMADDQLVGIRVAFEEVEVRARVKQAGGTWDRPRRVWQLAYGDAVALGLRDRVVADPASTSGCPRSSRKHLPADAAEASK